MDRNAEYTTEQEIKFLSSLRPAVIQKYMDAMPKRKVWEPLDPDAIMAACTRLLSYHVTPTIKEN